MNRRHPLLIEMQAALDDQAWDEAERLLREAQQLGLTHSPYGIPLRYLQNDLSQRRTESADRAAARLQAEAAALAQAGQAESARQRYVEAAAIPALSPETADQIANSIAQINDAADFGAPQDPAIERDLEKALLEVFASIQEQQPTLLELLRACAIPLWWDEPLLAEIRQRGDGREAAIMEKVGRFSFVFQWPHYYTFSRLARRLLLRAWEQDQPGFQKFNERILAYLQQRLDLSPPADPIAYERLVAAHLYHTFLGDPGVGVARLGELFQKAEDEYRLEAARQYVLALKELTGRVPAQYSAYIEYAEGWMLHLNHRENAALQVFQELAQRYDLLPDLQARVARGLGAVLVEQQKWAEAAVEYRKALAIFQQQTSQPTTPGGGQPLNQPPDQAISQAAVQAEIAETMTGLGNAYLRLAATAHGDMDLYAPDTSVVSWLTNLIGFCTRLPLVLYLLWRLRLPWDMRSWRRLGQNMDWVVGRLFGDAVHWFRQAENIFVTLGDREGLQRTRQQLGELYLALHHPQAAATAFRQVQSTPLASPYQQARATLGLAEALIRQGEYPEAKSLLHEALPIFIQLKHTRRIAQTQSRLGYLAAQENDPNGAISAYSAALTAWQSMGDAVRATDVIHAMEEVADASVLDATAAQTLAQTQEQVKERVYETRFIHPVMTTFQRLAAIMLWVMLVVVLVSSVRSENGTTIGAQVALKRPTQKESVEAFKPTTGALNDQEVVQAITKQVEPQLRKRVIQGALGGAVGAYLLLYTLVGLWLIAATRMRNVQARQQQQLILNDATISVNKNNKIIKRLHWGDITLLINNQRLMLGKLIELTSSVTLIGAQEQVDLSAHTRHYWALTRQHLPRLLPKTPVAHTGYALPYGFFGGLLLTSLLLLNIFIGLVLFDSPLATSPLPFTPYTPVDLYGLLFLGIGVPAVYWFVVQSLRNYLLRRPSPVALRAVALIALMLAAIAALQFYWWHLPLGRPDLLLIVLTFLFAGFALNQSFTMRRVISKRLPLYGGRSIALLAMLITLWLMTQELRSFHYLAKANAIFLEVEQNPTHDKAAARARYEETLTYYTMTLALRPEAYIYNSLGNVLTRLNEPEASITAYERAIEFDSSDLTYAQNLALAYREWASVTKEFGLRQDRYRQALAHYDQVIRTLAARSTLNPDLRGLQKSAYELRAATWHDLGKMYFDARQLGQTMLGHFENAQKDYEWLIQNDRKNPAGYVGKGWSRFYQRLTHPQGERAERRVYLEEAIAAFEAAIQQNPNYSPAYNGLGWMHWYISNEVIPGSCISGIKDPAAKADYIHQIETAIDAFNRGITANEGNGFFFRTRAHLNYIMGYCYPDQKIAYLQQATADYAQALTNDPRKDWFWRQGTIYQELGNDFTKLKQADQARASREAARQSYLKAIAQDPSYGVPRDYLREIYALVGRTEVDALDDILAAMKQEDTAENLLGLANDELKRNKFGLAATALERLVARADAPPESWRLLTQVMFQWAEVNNANQDAHYARALESAQQFLTIGQEDAEIYFILGRIYRKQDKLAQAQQALEKTKTLAATRPDVAYELGFLYLSLGEREKADAAYTTGATATQALADKEARVQIRARAAADLLLAPSISTTLTLPLVFYFVDTSLTDLNLAGADGARAFAAGKSALSDKKYDHALLALIAAVRLDPFNYDHRLGLRNALIDGFGAGQTDSGAAVLDIVMGRGNVDTSYDNLLAIAQSELAHNTFGLAVVALDRALNLQPQSQSTALLKAQAYQRWAARFPYPESPNAPERNRRAIAAAQQALTLGPENKEIYLVLGRAYSPLNQYQESMAAYIKAVALGASDEKTWTELGEVAYLAGNYAQSATAWGKMIIINAAEPRYYFKQGLAYVAQGNGAAAQQSYMAGIAAARALPAETRNARLTVALAELRSVFADPAALAAQWIEALEEEQNQ